MMRLIPGKTSVKVRLFKDITTADMIMAGIGILLLTLTLLTPFQWKYIAGGVVLVLFAVLLFRLDSEPVYLFLFKMLRFLISKKKYGKVGFTDIRNLMAFTDVDENVIHYDNKYYGGVIEISPVEFRFFSENRRKNTIENSLGAILRAVHADQGVNIVKLEKPISYESYNNEEYHRLEVLKESFENGMMTEEELKVREEVIYERINELSAMMGDEKIVEAFYYLVLFEADRRQLEQNIGSALQLLEHGEMTVKRVTGKDLVAFLKYSNELDFDEKEIEQLESSEDGEADGPEEAAQSKAEYAMPDRVFVRTRNVKIGKMIAHHFVISGFPKTVPDSWLASVLSIPSTKVVVKCTPTDQFRTIRSIDRSISELSSQYETTGITSRKIELRNHIESLTALLATLQDQNESLMDVNVYVTAYDRQLAETWDPEYKGVSARRLIANMKQTIRRLYREEGFKLNMMEFDQLTGFIGSQVSGYDPLKKESWNMPTNSIAAMYPWIFAHIEDEKGLKYGTHDGVPVMINFFQRNYERVNSNMVIVGKSGSGKSYATKSILTNLAAEDSKIFVLDPENEYTELANNLHGKFINVGNALQGRLNPFHIMTELEDAEEETDAVTGSSSMHMQFLEEFYRQILPDCDPDALEYLNLLTDRMYINRGITSETNLAKLRPEDYPTFDDLYDEILKEFQISDNEYIHTMLRTLINYISKFAAGGRNASIWNGPSSITTEENFTVFNFQSLLANRNQSIANAQMLLVLKYIDHEIIKNREYNLKKGKNRKVVVVIDEAHIFIDEKYPIALDFMFQLAKRIRKYNGMQIVITQNIKDFVGSEEIARKSAAIINACQYSLIFSLAPNDMDDLCVLYDKAGGINKKEQEEIVSAPRGQAFLVMGASKRATIQIEATELVQEVFENQQFETHYFATEEDRDSWEEYIAESRVKHEEESALRAVEAAEETSERSFVKVVEVDEDYLKTHMPEPVKKEEPKKAPVMTEDEMEEALRRLEEQEAAAEAGLIAPVIMPAPMPTPMSTPVAMGTVPIGTQPEAVPATVLVKPEGFDSMMAQMASLVENMGRFSYDAMREEMLRLINEQASALAGKAAGAVPDRAEMSYEEPEDEDSDDFSLEDLLDPEDEDSDDFSLEDLLDPEDEDNSDFSLEDLLDLDDDDVNPASEDDEEAYPVSEDDDDRYPASEDEEDAYHTYEDEDDEGYRSSEEELDDEPYFDIMQLLAQESELLASRTLIEEMLEEDEQVFEVTLDDLIAYVQKFD